MDTRLRNWKIGEEDLPKYSISDWEKWEGKWELIEGIPYAMAPMPGKKHQRLNGKLYAQFLDLLDNCPDCEVFLPVNFKIDNTNLLHPDLLIVCGEEEEGAYVTNIPCLVVEILSGATRKKDKETKPKIYGALGIRYYVLVDPKAEQVSIFELDDAKSYQLKSEGRDIAYGFEVGACLITCDFSRIWGTK